MVYRFVDKFGVLSRIYPKMILELIKHMTWQATLGLFISVSVEKNKQTILAFTSC